MQTVWLAGAGLLAGAMNAVAGGGSFVAFPALVAAGIPSQLANASTTVALIPGGLSSAWTYRSDLQPVGLVGLRAMAAISALGGLAGAALLLATSSGAFDRIVPFLLLLATVTLAAGDRVRQLMRRHSLNLGPSGTLGLQAVLAIYGGYFGGAVGLMMLACWSLVSTATLKELAPARTIMVTAANLAAALCFTLVGLVAWPQTAAMLAGSVAGGAIGARIGKQLPPRAVRWGVLAVSTATTTAFFAKGYL